MFCTPVHPAGFGNNSYYYPNPHFVSQAAPRSRPHRGYGYNDDDFDDYYRSYGAHPSSASRAYYDDSYARALERERARQAQILEARRKAAYEAQLRQEYAARQRQRQRAEEQAAAEEYQRNLLAQLFGYGPANAFTAPNATSQAGPSSSTSPALNINEEDIDNVGGQEQEEEEEDDATEAQNIASMLIPQIQASSVQSNTTQPKLSYDEAVEIIRRRGAQAALLRQRLHALQHIRTVFEQRRQEFTYPESLDFDLAKSEANGQPVLTYTPNNRPLQAYEEDLLRLLTDLDDVLSSGFETVKKTRKALAKDVQSELSRIDEHKNQLFRRLQTQLQ